MLMNEELFTRISIIWIVAGIVLFPVLLFIKQPYGRHTSKKWGILMDNQLGWLLMEVPSPLLFSILFFTGQNSHKTVNILIYSLWMLHYVHRTFIFPFLTKTKGKKIPVLIVLLGIFFNLVNAGLNGYFIGHFQETYQTAWIFSFPFITGVILFFTGMYINIRSDYTLISLRKKPGNGYKIPYGGMFKYVSCPNYLGEMIEWTGFALLSWNFASLAFAVWTYANLIPRALNHHKWYRSYFKDYPEKRKAVFPFIL